MDLSGDFKAYSHQNAKRRRRAIRYLWTAALLTTLSSGLCIALLSSSLSGSSFDIPAVRIPGFGRWGHLNNAENAMSFAHFSLNLVVASIVRYWFLRQDKLTTLLTEALVLEQENETAIRVLLNKKIN